MCLAMLFLPKGVENFELEKKKSKNFHSENAEHRIGSIVAYVNNYCILNTTSKDNKLSY